MSGALLRVKIFSRHTAAYASEICLAGHLFSVSPACVHPSSAVRGQNIRAYHSATKYSPSDARLCILARQKPSAAAGGFLPTGLHPHQVLSAQHPSEPVVLLYAELHHALFSSGPHICLSFVGQRQPATLSFACRMTCTTLATIYRAESLMPPFVCQVSRFLF